MIPPNRIAADAGSEETLARVAAHLDGGGLVAYPTETVYGLGARPDPAGVRAVRELKGRDDGKPFLVLLPPDSGAEEALLWTPAARDLARRFWPGPLTLVLADPDESFPPGVRSPRGGVAVRRSPQPFVEALLRRWPHPLLSTSANRPGDAPARTADEVERAVGGRPGLHRLWILDGGPLLDGGPSTVVDLTGPRPRLLRAGPIPAEALRAVMPDLEEDRP